MKAKLKFNLSFIPMILITFVINLNGQNFADTSLYIQEDIVINQNRLSLSVSESARNVRVINKTEIESLPVTNVPELLQYFGGLDIRRRGVNGVQSDAGIRGGTFNQVLVLINGVRMSDPQTGHHMMNLPVALEDIERVEVIKGPAARTFGMNAMTGVINIITKIREAEEFNLQAGVMLSDFETYGLNINARIPNEIFDQSFSLSRQGSEGYRYNTDYNINTLFYQAKLNLGKQNIDIQAGHTEREFGANGFYANEAFVDQYEEVRTSFVSATTNFIFDNLVVKPRINWRRNKDEYVFIRDNPSFFMNEHVGHTLSGELHATYTSNLGQTGIGFDLAKEDLESNNLGARNRTILGFFAEQRVSLVDDKLGITAGFYANKISDRDMKIYPGIDISYAVNANFNFYATGNWSDRIPTYTNLYYSSRTEQGNKNLIAESATSYEIGMKYNSKKSNITIGLFQRNNDNLIDWAKEEENQEKWLALNFNEVNTRGIDISTKWNVNSIVNVTSPVLFSFDYLYIHSEVEDNQNVAVSRYALDNLRHQLLAGLSFDILPHQLSISAQFRYLNRVSLKDYILSDARMTYRGNGYALFVNVNNIFDRIYRETNLVPMPGRYIGAGIRLF